MDGPRACQASEYEDVVSLINRIFRAGTDQDYTKDYPLMINPSTLNYMRIIKVDGKVAAHVTFSPPREVVALNDRFAIAIISATVTDPEYRRRGYATLCLQDCIRIMEEKRWPVSVLWTGLHNFPFYQRSDYEAVASQGWMYHLRPDEYELFHERPFRVARFSPAGAQHLDAIMKIHDAEPYRITRSREEYQALFCLPKISTYLAMKGQEVAAYLMLGEGMNKPGLIESGGPVEAVESLVRHVLRQRSAENEVQALVPLAPTILGRLLDAKLPARKRPIEEAKGVGHQMMRMNSLEGLLRRIETYLQNASTGLDGDVRLVCKETGEGITLNFRNGNIRFSAEQIPDQMVLTRRQLVQLIFGAHPSAEPIKCHGPAGDILQRVFPYYFPIWELDHA